MSDKIKDGGAAFPQISELGDIAVTSPGMTLRDWFAGQALVGIINACALDTRRDGERTENMFARKAFSIADAMIAARETGGAA